MSDIMAIDQTESTFQNVIFKKQQGALTLTSERLTFLSDQTSTAINDVLGALWQSIKSAQLLIRNLFLR
jgi:hypothetical protein